MFNSARQWIGSIAFTLYLFVSVPIYGTALLFTAPWPRQTTYRATVLWVESVLWLLRVLCRLDYVVEGREHLPAVNSVLLIKHSSAWETIAQWKIFPPQTWVIKRELMWTPFLGWVLRLLTPIAIDRRGGSSAVQQVLDQGTRSLSDGLWIAIFPEGTRVPAGETRRYGLSGALLAARTGRAVVPVAHNAGDYWPRRGWLKRAGTIRLVIGPPIPTLGREPRAINEDAQRWIEATVARIRPEAAVGTAAPSGGDGRLAD